MQRLLERVVLVLTLLVFSLVTWMDGARSPSVALAFSGAFAALLALRLILPQPRVGPSGARGNCRLAMAVSIPLMAWLLLTSLQAAGAGLDSVDPYQARIAFSRGVGYLAAWVLFMSLLDSTARLWQLAAVIVGVALLQAGFGIVNFYGDDAVFGWAPTHYAFHRVTGTYVNRNFFANLLVMAVGFPLVLLLARDRDPDRSDTDVSLHGLSWLIALPVLPLLLAGLLLSGSRGAMLSFVVATMLLLLLLSVMPRVRLSFWPVVLSIGGAVGLFGAGILRFRFASLDVDSSDRLEQWRSTLEMIAIRPWTGYGAGAYETAFRNRQTGDLGPLTYNHAHNDYLQLLLEQGIAGLILAVIPVAVVLLVALRCAWRCGSQRRKRWILSSGFGVSAMLFHALVDFPFQVPANVWVFIALMAIMASATTIEFAPGSNTHPGHRPSPGR